MQVTAETILTETATITICTLLVPALDNKRLNLASPKRSCAHLRPENASRPLSQTASSTGFGILNTLYI